MDYDEEAAAWAADEIARLTAPGFTGPRGQRPDFGAQGRMPDYGPAAYQGGGDVVQSADADQAIGVFLTQLASERGQSLDEVYRQVTALSTGNSADERAAAVLALAGMPAADAVTLSGDDLLGLTVSAAERRALAAKGQALGPDGDFPIPDRAHVSAAVARYKAGQLAGHPKSVVREHILKNARRLGVPVDLGDDGHDDHDDGRDDTYERADHRGRTRKPRRGREHGSPGTDGSDSFHAGGGAGGFDTGGPSGQSDGGAMAASAAILARQASSAEVLYLTAERVSDPGQRDLLLRAARLKEMQEDEARGPVEGEVARLTRSYYPDEFGLSARPPGEGPEAGEVDRIMREHAGITGRRAGSEREDDRSARKVGSTRHPSRPGRKVTTRTRAHEEPGRDASSDAHAEIQRYLRHVQSTFSPDKPYGASQSYGPKSRQPTQR